jgi:hypothetical protein
MAEIMTLIIFALLLALDFAAQKESNQVIVLTNQLAELRQRLNDIIPAGTDPKVVEDIFRELVLARERGETIASLDARVALLDEKSKALEGKVGQYERIDKLIKSGGLDAADPTTVDDLFRDLVRAHERGETVKSLEAKAAALDEKVGQYERLEKTLRSAGIESPDKPVDVKALADLLQNAAGAEATLSNLRGQVANLREAARASGKGTQFPPCWADEQTGKPEFIFDVSITSSGLIIGNNAIPHRADQQAKLPLEAIDFRQTLSLENFLRETRGLFEFSQRQDPTCRFFVRLYDLTKPDEKAIFKDGQRTVEAHFYKLLMNDIAGAPK